MDKEQIEKAANAYTQEVIDSNTFDVNFEEDNYDAGSLHATSEVCPMAFKAGAEWRINSVWHDKKEKPVCKGERKFCDIFYISKKGYPRANTYSENGFLLYRGEEWRDVKYWAYVEDLLSTNKGCIE